MNIDINVFKNQCTCGETHDIFVQAISIQKGAITKINEFLKQNHWNQKVGIVCDDHTAIYAKEVEEYIEVVSKKQIELNSCGLHANEHGIKQLEDAVNQEEYEVLIAVGSGTIHDLTRYIAHSRNIPFISAPTASSVDGFVSTVSAMTIAGCKKTLPGISPIAVFADTNIFAKAPRQLTASGVSDLLGKYTALLDWKVSHILTDEYICNRIVQMEEDAIDKVIASMNGLKENKEEAHENLMYALLLSGLAMQMIGNSRPASGSEHHMSHFWEMHVINPETQALHGEKVGVGLVLVCEAYKQLLNITQAKDHVIEYKGIPFDELKVVYKELYEGIKEENTIDYLKDIGPKKVIEEFPKIQELVRDLPSGEQLRSLIQSVDGKITMEDIGLSNDIIKDSLTYSPFVRQRLTLMRLMQMIQ